ncbi:hypothetical protein MTO96_039440 [Rhipicephalus appendiculatus]
MNRRPFAPPPIFRGKGEEDLGDWLHLYERYGLALSWTDVEKPDNLVFVLEDASRRWYVTALRENTLKTWEDWRKALMKNFSGDRVQEWAYMQLQQPQQQLVETPQKYAPIHKTDAACKALTSKNTNVFIVGGCTEAAKPDDLVETIQQQP